jgi:hypothetical protein
MDIIRNPDGTLVVPVEPARTHTDDESTETELVELAPTTRVLHPGEGGYDEALTQWDLEQNPDRGPAVSTRSGRQEAMALIHALAESDDLSVTPALEALEDPEASAEALRHVLIGGVHSVEDFLTEVSDTEGGEPISAHEGTKIIGQVLAEVD